jgi:acetylornithine deacetylase/succinyl-diaminopimelate desuccinylase-like protein
MRVHGNDERLSIENIRRGTVVMLDLVESLVDPSGAEAPAGATSQ